MMIQQYARVEQTLWLLVNSIVFDCYFKRVGTYSELVQNEDYFKWCEFDIYLIYDTILVPGYLFMKIFVSSEF